MLFLLLLGIWIVFNGKFTIEILIIGCILAAAISLFTWKVLGFGPKQEGRLLKKSGKMILYGLFLFKEIIKANWGVMKIVLNPRSKVRPTMTYFRTDLKKDSSRVVLSNSITITPGTVIVNVCDDIYFMHALDASMAEGADECDFVVKLRELEGKD